MPDLTETEKFRGLIVKHAEFGLGRIEKVDIKRNVVQVQFFTPLSRHNMKFDAITQALIPTGTHCKTRDKGNCIVKGLGKHEEDKPNTYKVEFEDGLTDEIDETKLFPTKLEKSHDPIEILCNLDHEGYPIFKAREQFESTYTSLVKRGAGVKSLLSSRINLYPHQAFVAGTVILDNKQRYILADEVGLGKTIEAGIVIHDLLSRNSKAKILILCPGTLVQQWFSEMYSKFCGVIFKLPELSKDSNEPILDESQPQIILSFHAALNWSKKISKNDWDLVVVDEVQHLLSAPSLYELVSTLSKSDKGLLLLSALPAQHREEEYYDLLRLLEPKDDSLSREKFKKLFHQQSEIGGRLGVINRRLIEFESGELKKPDRVIQQLKKIFEIDTVGDDKFLKERIKELTSKDELSIEGLIEGLHEIIYYISDYYRINRRILRNRREKLINTKKLERIERSGNRLHYKSSQYEIETRDALQRLLQSMIELKDDFLIPLTKELLQAATHPTTLYETLSASGDKQTNKFAEEYKAIHGLESYSEWDSQIKYLWSQSLGVIDQGLLEEAIDCAKEWESQGDEENNRLQELLRLLDEKHLHLKEDKFILFAGHPNLASIIAEKLIEHYDEESVARFYFGLGKNQIDERELKEKEVKRFEKGNAWLLICDETGGEGRNFQFASELIHYDLPLQITKIEQRIGRLDRLGRKRKDVISNTITLEGSKEDAWLTCLTDGLGIFNQSISGLEFALRDIENLFIRKLLSDDEDLLYQLVPDIKQQVIKERASDESQNQIDEASYERKKAQAFHRVQLTQGDEEKLQNHFVQYFNMISKGKSLKNIHDDDYHRGIIEFYPEDIDQIALDLSDKVKERTGTFIREIAQNRPNLEFFCVGNDFFDSMCRSLFTHSKGRTYAIECKTTDFSSWRGFEFSYRIKPGDEYEVEDFAYQNRLDYIFAEHTEKCFIDENSKTVESPQKFLTLRRSFNNENKGSWKNLTKDNSIYLTNFYKNKNWSEFLKEKESEARKHVEDRFNKILDQKIKNSLEEIDEEIRKLQTQAEEREEFNEKVELLNQLKNIINTKCIELNAVGFLSINGGVFND